MPQVSIRKRSKAKSMHSEQAFGDIDSIIRNVYKRISHAPKLINKWLNGASSAKAKRKKRK